MCVNLPPDPYLVLVSSSTFGRCCCWFLDVGDVTQLLNCDLLTFMCPQFIFVTIEAKGVDFSQCVSRGSFLS